jgi:hypothetical protein
VKHLGPGRVTFLEVLPQSLHARRLAEPLDDVPGFVETGDALLTDFLRGIGQWFLQENLLLNENRNPPKNF